MTRITIMLGIVLAFLVGGMVASEDAPAFCSATDVTLIPPMNIERDEYDPANATIYVP